MTCQILVELLREIGYRVTSADGGDAMRAVLDRTDHGIDVVVLDFLLPGEQGSSLALHVTQDLGLPVLLISGSDEATEFATDHNLQLLQKPFHSGQLAEAITQAMLAQRRARSSSDEGGR